MNSLRRGLILACVVGLVPGLFAQNAKPAAEAQKAQQEAIEKAQRDYFEQLKKAQEEAAKAASHSLLKEIKITGKNGIGLQTLSVDANGRVLALVAPPRGFSRAVKGVTSEVHVLDADGKETAVWTVDFHATAVNPAPDGSIYVAGDGKVAHLTKDGKPIGEVVSLPFIADMLKDNKAMREKAEKQVTQQKDSFKKLVQQYKERIEKLEAKKEDELTKTEKTQLTQFKRSLESFKETEKYYESMTVESVLEGLLGRVKVISSVAVAEKDLYIVCGENEGYGFGVWRMGHDYKNAKKILANISGCCGQMDLQCCGEDILVAENTKHRFARYDRDGKELATGGKRGKETEPGCFGGCCNPMNVRSCGGEVLTAESEGLIKRFGPTGEFLGIVGAVSITGGCKNVAIGTNKDASRVYFCDQPGGRVLILAKKTETKK